MKWEVVLLAALLLASTGVGAAPYRPSDDAEVLERLPEGLADRGAARAVPIVRPDDPTLAAALGRAWIESARREADPRYLGYAEAALAPYASRPDAPPEIVLLRATLRQSRHQFDEALADLDRVLARAPDASQAWLTRAAILRVQGRYAEAREACVRVATGAPFAARVCGAAVDAQSGGLARAHETLAQLSRAAAQRPRAERAWLAAERADAAERLGRDDEAEAIYQSALAEFPDDWSLRAAFADLLLDTGRVAQAAHESEGHERIEALLLRELIAKHRLGCESADLRARVADGFAAARRRGEELHLREEARYALEIEGDAPRALALALRNWSTQREPWDARVLLDAARAAGDPRAADPVREWIGATGFEDARIAAPIAAEVR